MLPNLADQLHAVKVIAELPVCNNQPRRALLEMLPQVLCGTECGDVCAIQYKLVFDMRAIVLFPDREIDFRRRKASHN
jgi:hypothetical protein